MAKRTHAPSLPPPLLIPNYTLLASCSMSTTVLSHKMLLKKKLPQIAEAVSKQDLWANAPDPTVLCFSGSAPGKVSLTKCPLLILPTIYSSQVDGYCRFHWATDFNKELLHCSTIFTDHNLLLVEPNGHFIARCNACKRKISVIESKTI